VKGFFLVFLVSSIWIMSSKHIGYWYSRNQSAVPYRDDFITNTHFPLGIMTLWHSLCSSCPETPEYSGSHGNIWHNMLKLSVCGCHPSATEMNGNADGYPYPGITDSLCSCMFHSLSSVSEKLLTRPSCSSFHMLLWKIIILIDWLRGIWEWNESHIQEVETPLMKVKSGRSPWAAFDITCFTSCPSGHWKWTVYGLFLETLEVLCKNKKLASCV